jgi:hypothetical protein
MFHLLVMESCFFVTLVLLVAGVKHLYIAFSLESFIEFLLYTHLCLISVDSYEKYACPIEGMDF